MSAISFIMYLDRVNLSAAAGNADMVATQKAFDVVTRMATERLAL
ncbi:hypothetical protein [Paraburkholderia sp. HP33-1]|nr:hypothetical protein [Paraburkholderia sp. HP33-1]